jgi:nucleotide-binding universal stress UspA family protein
MSTFKHVLVATDFGKPAERALDLAATFAVAFGAKLTVVFVFSVPAAPASEKLDTLREEGQRMLEASAKNLRARLPAVACVMRAGAPWEEILVEAKENHADLIVMGTHGRRGLPRGLLGSVAERVVRMARVPVLTVAAPEEDACGQA